MDQPPPRRPRTTRLYDDPSVSFAAERKLRRYLGEYDAGAEVGELALRFLVATAHAKSDPAGFVEETSLKHGVRVDMQAFHHAARTTARTYLVVVVVFSPGFGSTGTRVLTRSPAGPSSPA